MVAIRDVLREVYPATAASVPLARQAIVEMAEAAGAGERLLDRIRLAATEAMSNSVVHAYPETTGEFEVVAAVAGDELWLLIADNGCGHLTPAANPGLGWGLALIAEATNSFVIAERAGGGTEVRLFFRLGPARRRRQA